VAQSLTQQWLASHGLFGTSIFAYRHMGAAWVKRHVRIEESDILDALRSKGGLVLTYHTHHHNTLGIVLGQSGVTTWGVAATEKASPMAPYTGSFMRIINGQSEAKFAGGRYLFTDEPRQLLKGLKQAFGNNQAVVSLCDNPTPSGSQPPIHFLGKTFHVGSGVLELALEQGVPVTLAILYPDLKGSYVLRMKTISSDQSASQILQTYFDFLASCVVQVPWAWQGWHWFSGLPKLERS
jgi:lauroyl/myristoyl acyltransferase